MEGLVSSLSPKAKGRRGLREARPILDSSRMGWSPPLWGGEIETPFSKKIIYLFRRTPSPSSIGLPNHRFWGLSYKVQGKSKSGGKKSYRLNRVRTDDSLFVRQELYQLSYEPWNSLVFYHLEEKLIKGLLKKRSTINRNPLFPLLD